MAQGLLKESGILAYTAGGQATSTFTVAGIASVPLQVPQSCVEEAAALLAKEFDAGSDVPEWTCASCSAEVDAGFAVCWQCGADYADGTGGKQHDNLSGAEGSDCVNRSDDTQPETIEQRVNRAMAASILAMIVFPFVFYAGHLIIECLDKPKSMAAKGKLVIASICTAFSALICWFWFQQFLSCIARR